LENNLYLQEKEKQNSAIPLKALMIEEDKISAHNLKEQVQNYKKEPLELVCVDTLSKGFEVFSGGSIDVLLLDLNLSNSKGLETFYIVKAQITNIPIIILSNEDDDAQALKAVQAGAQDFLIKNYITGRSLVRSIKYAIERYRLVSELEQARKVEHYLAYHDTLTKLPNRQLFYDRLIQALARARRNSQLLAVLFLDLDGFKDINDSLGHSVGDMLLQVVARRLETCIRENETAARFGGDEFTIILNEIAHAQDITNVARRILDTLSQPVILAGKESYISATIGISIFPHDGKDAETLIRNADIAMYRTKTEGKRSFQFYNKSMNIKFSQRVKLAGDLRKALERDELVVLYQPQVNIRTGAVECIEAFLQWNHPELGAILSEKFIPIAEETGLIHPIAKWLMKKAFYQLCVWQEEGFYPLKIAINLTENQLRQKDLYKTINRIIKETQIHPSHIIFEFTENGTMQQHIELRYQSILRQFRNRILLLKLLKTSPA
jgi:diguanylate cyclase (GGDEF)-like protein